MRGKEQKRIDDIMKKADYYRFDFADREDVGGYDLKGKIVKVDNPSVSKNAVRTILVLLSLGIVQLILYSSPIGHWESVAITITFAPFIFSTLWLITLEDYIPKEDYEKIQKIIALKEKK